MEVTTLVTDNKTKQRYSPAPIPDIHGPGTAPHTAADPQHGCAETVPGAGMSVSSQELWGAPFSPKEFLPLTSPAWEGASKLWSDPPCSMALLACKCVGFGEDSPALAQIWAAAAAARAGSTAWGPLLSSPSSSSSPAGAVIPAASPCR